MKPFTLKRTSTLRVTAALFLIAPLAACGGDAVAPSEHGEAGSEAEKGPHNGRLLRDGDFAVEMTIFEEGQEPQFRVYPTREGNAVDPKTVQLTVTLKRLDGETNRFAFSPERDYLAGQGFVEEPHSFDVEVVAAEVQDQGGVGRDRQVHLAPVGVDRREGEQLLEQVAHLAVVGVGEDLSLQAPQQLRSDIVEVDDVRRGAGAGGVAVGRGRGGDGRLD